VNINLWKGNDLVMTIEELISKMGDLIANGDEDEKIHQGVDLLMLEYINDPSVTSLYNSIPFIGYSTW
jgi:hypothetical protein